MSRATKLVFELVTLLIRPNQNLRAHTGNLLKNKEETQFNCSLNEGTKLITIYDQPKQKTVDRKLLHKNYDTDTSYCPGDSTT
jgi:hypothetical protein